MERGLRVITLQGEIEKSPILLSQYWKNERLDGNIIISYFGCSNNIFADCKYQLFININTCLLTTMSSKGSACHKFLISTLNLIINSFIFILRIIMWVYFFLYRNTKVTKCSNFQEIIIKNIRECQIKFYKKKFDRIPLSSFLEL